MRLLILIASLVFSPVAAIAEPIAYFGVDGVSYDESVPTPESRFGHGLGEKPVRHDLMVAYLTELSEGSPRITHEVLGYSHEGRPILGFVVTSEDNHARLDEIRARHLARLDPENEDTDGPAVVWLNYGVHGAESSGMDAAIPVLRHLAAAQGEEIERTLEETVILIVAVFNPDGHARRIDHVYQHMPASEVTNRDHVVHDIWTEARVNHYWLDLNRQWLLLTQPESRAWISFWHRWKPNVSGDYHEMGSPESTYYFHPGEPKRRNPLIPDDVPGFLAQLAKGHRAALDRRDELYYSEEGFDNFYLGKGSTYPSVNGSVGILFEAGAARGGAVEGPTGVRRYAENIRLHFDTSLSTIEGARTHRADLRAYQRAFFEEALTAEESGPAAYVFTTAGDRARLTEFVQLLQRHDISAEPLRSPLTQGRRTYPAGSSYLVRMRQPQRLLIRGLFERSTAFEENTFYDVSGWTLPLAYDLDYAPLDADALSAAKVGVPRPAQFQPAAAPEKAEYGYLFAWSEYYAPRALGRLLRAGVRARVVTEPKTLLTGGEELNADRGSIFVPLSRQETGADDIHALMETIAREDGITVHALSTGDAVGAGDLGARGSVRSLEAPTILLLFGDGIRRYDAGEVWHLLDLKMRTPVVLRDKADFGGLDLGDYTHLIAPGGARFSDAESEEIADWVRAGGVLIALRDAAVWAEGVFNDADGEDAAASDDGDTPRYDYADLDVRNAEHVIGGAIFGADLDITHPIGFGYADRAIAFQKNASHALRTPTNPFATVARYKDAPLLSGYASDRRIGEIQRTPAIIADRYGRGAVVLFADDPVFRATYLGADKLLMNAIYFAKTIDPSRLPD